MQLARTTTTATLFLIFGMIVPAYAQRDKQNERQGEGRGQQQHSQRQQRPQHQERAQQTERQRPPQHRAQEARQQQPHQQRDQQTRQLRPQQQQAERSQQARPQQQRPHHTQQQAVAWQQQRGWLQQGGWQGRGTWQHNRAQRWESDHRTWAQRGGYGGYYIPQSRFSLYFGRQHWFRMHSRPTIYMGYPRFSYGGFSFLLVDPWPEYWAEDWCDTDDVYVDYDDGYYLYNRSHPGVALAISVVM